MRTRTPIEYGWPRYALNRAFARSGAAACLAAALCPAPASFATQAAGERVISEVRIEERDADANGIPDAYENAPYTGHNVVHGLVPPGVVLSVFPLPVQPGGSVHVAVLHGGRERVLRMRLEPDIGAPLMVDQPAASNGVTSVPFRLALPKLASGDSLRVTVWLLSAILSRSVPIESHPDSGDFVHIDSLPEVTRRVAPTYPVEARRARVSGTVMVQALVGTDGRVLDTRVTKSVPGLDEAAEQCVRQWRFKPARNGGRPIACWVAAPVRFSLH